MSSTISSLEYKLYTIQQEMTRYIHSIYLIFGVTGCCLSIFLLSRRQFQTSSCCTYFLSMSIIMLIHIIIASSLNLYTLNHKNPVTSISSVCKIRFYILQSTAMMYRWCLTIACFDRFTITTINVRLRNFAKIHIARRVVIINVIVWIILPGHALIFYNLKENTCGIFDSIIASLYHSVFITITASILPISIMIICALLIRYNLALRRHRREQNTYYGKTIGKLQNKRDQQVLIMLFFQMLLYGITIIPIMGVYFYNSITIYTNKLYDRIIIERFISYLVETINFFFPVCSFYLYTMASYMFRIELKKMLYTLVKYLWLGNATRIGPMRHEMRPRAIIEHRTASVPVLQTNLYNKKKEIVIYTIEKQENIN